jgi:serine/threonine protein kinase/Tol biopolymer transport system component
MGEVYQARDTRLERTVAIKVLSPALATDPAFRERFEREARTISGLTHPHICTLYDVGNQDGVEFLVMEFLEGQTLAERLEGGPLKLDEALRIAIQIADALDRAHRFGIVHRDLKPGNVMLVHGHGSSGALTAKLLDFGLAKPADSPATTATTIQKVPDVTRASVITAQGTIVGSFQYMAPEQLEGTGADARTDIWAFGCLLYEMASGRRPFDAPTQAGLIAAILEREPPPLTASGMPTPAGLERLIDACLMKNPDDRFQSLRDVRRELEWLSEAPLTEPAGQRKRPRARTIAAAAGAVVVVAAATAVITRTLTRQALPAAPVLFDLTVPSPQTDIRLPSVSPDGSRIAFVADYGAVTSIWVRRLDKVPAEPVEGTAGARGMFWSPDGESIAFFAGAKLKIVELATEKIGILCDAPSGFGGAWGPDGTILFSPDERAPIYRVSAQGGTPTPVTTLDPARRDQAHRWPQFLPDGRHFVFMPWNDATTKRSIQLASLDSAAAPRTLFESQSAAIVAGDYLLFAADQPTRLMAWAFDAESLEVRGQPIAAVSDNNVDYDWMSGELRASISRNGTLVYTTGKNRDSLLTWMTRAGRVLGTVGEPGVHFDPMISRDGNRVSLEKHDRERASGDIWTIDLQRGAFSRLTSAAGFETTPVWSPDGRRVAYASDQGTLPKIYVRDASGTGAEEVLVPGDTRPFATDWSRDGGHVLLMTNGGRTRMDIWSFDVARGVAAPMMASPFNEGWATFSPDGRWIAFVSDAAQQRQVYVRSFPDGAAQTQISTGGGSEPQWRQDGRELFYVAPDNTIMAVSIHTSSGRVTAGTPNALFTASIDQTRGIRNHYAASPDGQRFLLLATGDRHISRLVTVLNWRELLAR